MIHSGSNKLGAMRGRRGNCNVRRVVKIRGRKMGVRRDDLWCKKCKETAVTLVYHVQV